MNTHEKVELALIPAAVAAVGLAGPLLPSRMASGALLQVACLALLVQGGVRDLWLLRRARSRPAAQPRRKVACMCLESSLGLTGIGVGICLAVSGLGGTVGLSTLRWTLLAAGTLTLGFLARDLVISWRPLGLRRVPDHHSVIFTWW